jgi:hypothetical protein
LKFISYWNIGFDSSLPRAKIRFPSSQKVIVVLIHFDKDDGFIARARDTITSLKNQFVKWVDVISKPTSIDGFSTKLANIVASFIEANITNVLQRLQLEYKVCNEVQSTLKHWMTQNLITVMMNWKTFFDLCQETYLPSLVTVIVEGSMVEARRKAMARSMHNSRDIIYVEDLDFLVVNLDWFCHRVMGHLIKINDDHAKLSFTTHKDGFTSRAYLEKVLNDSLKSFHELGYHRSLSYITVQNLVELMLKLELCFERTIGSKNDSKLVMPTILNIDQ